LTFTLLDQAIRQRECADFVSICFPQRRGGLPQSATILVRHCRLGVFEATRWPAGLEITERRNPGQNQQLIESLRDDVIASLQPEHKTYAPAGSPTGKRWTAFRSTCKQVRALVAEQGPLPVRFAMERVDHHYASSKSAVNAFRLALRRSGGVEGLRLNEARWPALVELAR